MENMCEESRLEAMGTSAECFWLFAAEEVAASEAAWIADFSS